MIGWWLMMHDAAEKYLSEIYREYGIYNKRYSKLLSFLLEMPFYCTLEEDESRLEDGRFLRKDLIEYGHLERWEDEIDDIRISVLEVILALAIRMDAEYTGDPCHPYPENIFWELLMNLGFRSFSNRDFKEQEADDILENWMNRKFERNGEGSLFPLRHSRRDQTRIPIWGQMNEYIRQKNR